MRSETVTVRRPRLLRPPIRSPNYVRVVQSVGTTNTSSALKTGVLTGVVITTVILIGLAIGIGLGVGLGVGLEEDIDSLSFQRLTALTVNCTYNESTCGCPFVAPSFSSSRISGGTTSLNNSWPWTVAIYINNQSFCAGFLAYYRWVVTTASCISGVNATNIQVYAGLQKLSARVSAQNRTVSQYAIHPNYTASTLENDIAVLKLQSSFNPTVSVGLCCLTSNSSLPSVNDIGAIVGWGSTSSSSSAQSDDLMQGIVKVQQNSLLCSTSNSDTQFCAGFGNTGACSGDVGSPFMANVNNTWTCTGIVSSLGRCGKASRYTRVSAYQSFIDTSILELSDTYSVVSSLVTETTFGPNGFNIF